MADEFSQLIKGATRNAETIVATDGLTPIAIKKDDKWVPMEVDSSTGALLTSIDSGTITTVTTVGTIATISSIGTVTNDVTIDATDLDIRALNTTDDKIKIGDGSETLAINSDGSINVSVSGASNNVYINDGINIVKGAGDTLVVAETPATVDEYIKAVLVSGAGLCKWTVWVGPTGSEVEILDIWTTPACPTKYVDIPDSLQVTASDTIYISAINKEVAATPASDFIGYGTIIRNA